MRHQDTATRNMFYHCLEYDHEQSGEVFLVASGVEQCNPGEVCGPHIRDCYHLHVILSGTGVLYCGGKEYHPSVGQMFLLKHNEECTYIADENDPWHYGWVTFHGPMSKRIIEDIGFVEGVYCLDSHIPAKEFFDLIQEMHCYPEMTDINDLYRRGILHIFLAKAIEATGCISPQRNSLSRHSIEEYVGRSLDFIHYNYATITVNDIIDFVGFSRSYFSTAFRSHTGTSLQEYLMNYRLTKSREMLSTTTLAIQDIALKVGYENQMTFSRTFRKAYGVSPSEYREQGKKYADNK